MRILLLPLAIVLINAAPAEHWRIGPGGVRVETATETYEDQHHQRHPFEVPKDWRDYHHPLGWYRAHPKWWRESDWYRRATPGIDADGQRNESRG